MNLFNEINIINELCFDVGANIGNKTEKFLSYGDSVICIEPQTYCNSILESKFSTNENSIKTQKHRSVFVRTNENGVKYSSERSYDSRFDLVIW